MCCLSRYPWLCSIWLYQCGQNFHWNSCQKIFRLPDWKRKEKENKEQTAKSNLTDKILSRVRPWVKHCKNALHISPTKMSRFTLNPSLYKDNWNSQPPHAANLAQYLNIKHWRNVQTFSTSTIHNILFCCHIFLQQLWGLFCVIKKLPRGTCMLDPYNEVERNFTVTTLVDSSFHDFWTDFWTFVTPKNNVSKFILKLFRGSIISMS